MRVRVERAHTFPLAHAPCCKKTKDAREDHANKIVLLNISSNWTLKAFYENWATEYDRASVAARRQREEEVGSTQYLEASNEMIELAANAKHMPRCRAWVAVAEQREAIERAKTTQSMWASAASLANTYAHVTDAASATTMAANNAASVNASTTANEDIDLQLPEHGE